MIQKRLDDRSKGVILSGTRFAKRKHSKEKEEEKEEFIKLKKNNKKQQKKLMKASHSLDQKFNILKNVFEDFISKSGRRLKKKVHSSQKKKHHMK